MIFDAYIGIDWSGAARGYDGIAVAICRNGRAAPKLVAPRRRFWTRGEIAEWLDKQLQSASRLLIGFDFGFSFPYEPEVGYLGGLARGVDDVVSLWSLIESKSAGEADFGCMTFLNDPMYSGLFWTTGPKPQRWVDRKRLTEDACSAATQTHPDTLYKLLHSKQVGKASITGMRVLRGLRSKNVAVWPFEKVERSALVEMYPTMFRKIATGSTQKLRSRSALNAALRPFNSESLRSLPGYEYSDHETDALTSAAGLRWLAADSTVWRVPAFEAARIEREGWIFGVRHGCVSDPLPVASLHGCPPS
jgi:hypothetical protein